MKKCVAANKALAELKGAGDLIPNQAILINAIPLQEAKLSSEIENIVTTQDALFQAALDESRDDRFRHQGSPPLPHGPAPRQRGGAGRAASALALARRALRHAARPEGQFPLRRERLHRKSLPTNHHLHAARRAPIVMQRKAANLEEFLLADDDLDPLVRMAVAHYQFEAIHPFTDGNGRTGRILNILFLLHAGLLRIPVLYLSRHLIQNKAEYYRLLRGVTERSEWEEWLLFMLTGVEETADWTTGRIVAIRDLFDQTLARCRAKLPSKVYSKELVELVFTQPYCKIQFLVDAGIAQRQTASEYLQELEKIGVLTAEKQGREMLYKHPALLGGLGCLTCRKQRHKGQHMSKNIQYFDILENHVDASDRCTLSVEKSPMLRQVRLEPGEQFGLLRLELVVGQDALLMQIAQALKSLEDVVLRRRTAGRAGSGSGRSQGRLFRRTGGRRGGRFLR